MGTAPQSTPQGTVIVDTETGEPVASTSAAQQKRVDQALAAQAAGGPPTRVDQQAGGFEEGVVIQSGGKSFIVSKRDARKLVATPGTGTQDLATLQAVQEQKQLDVDLATREELFARGEGDELIGELGGLIEEKPSLQPTPISEKVVGVGFKPAELLGRTLDKVTGQDPEIHLQNLKNFEKTKFGKVVGGIGTATMAVMGASMIPAAAVATATKWISATMSAKIGLLGTATAGLGAFLGGRKAFNWRGEEMDTHRAMIQGMVEDGEKIEASNKNGYPSSDTIELLRTMADEVAFAEQRIKELGENNAEYRFSKEYLDDANNVRTARIALLRRSEAVRNTALTGQSTVDPTALMINAKNFKP